MSKIPQILLGVGLLTMSSHAATLADLKHRWSFNGDLTDSVSGATAVVTGAAGVVSNQLELPGGPGAARANAASIPIGATIAGTQSMTVEMWFTMDAVSDWRKGYMFGNDTTQYIDFTPNAGDGQTPSASFRLTGGNELNTRGGANPAKLLAATSYQATIVYDANADLISMYLGGALVDSVAWTGQISDLGNTSQNYIGAAVGFGDADLDGRVDEFRIWTTALSSTEVAANSVAGPNTVAVPEASAIALGLMGSLGILRRRRQG
ncbi:MAG: hypothetical protein JWO82_3448 [Akkermansiaceae bacterium]|nr:hypothetical protein [Akkermansiaceae bacterium]